MRHLRPQPIHLVLAAVLLMAATVTYPPVQIQNSGTPLVQRYAVNFTGAGVTCADNSGSNRTDCTISGGGSSGYQTIQQSGSSLTARTTLNFTGAGVTCVDNSGAARTDCTITGGGGGSTNTLETSINLGSAAGGYYSFTVTGQTWVTSSSIIVCQPFGTTADGQTPETVAAANIQPIVSNRVAGTGFTLNIYTPHGATGTYRIHCLGI